jgi:hypothetical protein
MIAQREPVSTREVQVSHDTGTMQRDDAQRQKTLSPDRRPIAPDYRVARDSAQDQTLERPCKEAVSPGSLPDDIARWEAEGGNLGDR